MRQRRYMKWSRGSREAKLVKAEGKEYLRKVKAAVDLQLSARAEKKKRKIKRALNELQELKKSGGPVTCNDIGRLSVMHTKELLSQISYLRCTIAPHIKQKRKVGNKFELFSDEEMRLQIIDVLNPNEPTTDNMDELIVRTLSEVQVEDEDGPSAVPDDGGIGQIGIWKGPFDRQCVGVLVAKDKLQLFRKVKRGYFKISDLPEDKCEWELQEIIPEADYEYVEQQDHILLKLNQ